MNVRATDFVLFQVSDLGRAVRFYRDLIGLTCQVENHEYQWAEFDCGNVTLSLKGHALSDGGRGGGRIALAVADVYEAFTELKAAGFECDSAPVDNGCCQHLEIRDPDGNTIILHRRAAGSCGQN